MIEKQFLISLLFQLFKRQAHKIVKHDQTIRWQQQSRFDHFVGLSPKGLKITIFTSIVTFLIFHIFNTR